jgi:Golgi SNAP receptor complex protein 2
MDTLLTQTSVIIRELQHDLLSYENAPNHETDLACSNLLNNKFQRLLEMCDRLDMLVNKEPAQTRAQSRQRVNEIKYDIKHYQVRSFYLNNFRIIHKYPLNTNRFYLTKDSVICS